MDQIAPQVGARQAPSKINLVTFRQFATLAHERSWTAQLLAERFRGLIEAPSEFFYRVLSGKTPYALIPYRSVIALYLAPQQSVLPFDGDLTPNQGVSTNREPIV